MSSKIVLFGATGYTGHLVAGEMVNGGLLKTGVWGLIEAFGLDKLTEGCDQSGLNAVIQK